MSPDDHQKLIKIAGLLSSENEGERANAAALATALLKRSGLSWEEALSCIAIGPRPMATPPDDLFVEDELSRLRSELAVSEALRAAQLYDAAEAGTQQDVRHGF